MGVGIEVYRLRIGSHHNLTNCRNRLHCLKGKLWNQILLMFYLDVFYFPYLQSLLKKEKSNREVCQWYVQMIYYHAVYVPLLLRLSNDVEENPGPRTISDIVDPTYTVHADFNQGNELMFGINAGKQCVAMSLCAIVYKEIKSVNIWDRLMLNSILMCGNNLYSIISQSINKSYLLLTDVPEFVDIENHAFNLQYSDSFSGALHMNEDSHPYVSLEHAFNEVFVSLHYSSCLLTVGMNTVAIMMPFPGVFKVFDSHSRDDFGRPSPLGYCVLISVEGIENLGEYFRLTTRSNVVTPFELKGVKCINNDYMQAESSATVGVVGSIEISEQYDVSSPNFDQTTQKITSNISTEQSESRAKRRKYRNMKKTSRQNESEEQREARLAKLKEYNKSNTAKETPEQSEARLAKMREYNNSNTAKETTEQRKARLEKMREYNNSTTVKETTEQRKVRLAKMREYSNSNTANKATEQRKVRLAKMREYNNSKRQNETAEQREARLAKERERKRASRKRASTQKQGERKGKCTSHPLGKGTSNPVSNYFLDDNIDELALIRKFHNSVCAGPLYICTCCDQL